MGKGARAGLTELFLIPMTVYRYGLPSVFPGDNAHRPLELAFEIDGK